MMVMPNDFPDSPESFTTADRFLARLTELAARNTVAIEQLEARMLSLELKWAQLKSLQDLLAKDGTSDAS